jgi:hypothetical protein
MLVGRNLGMWMTSSIDFVVSREFQSLATRESGARAREAVLEALESHESVTLDFTGAHPTPSFADELVGRLASALGEACFRTKVRIVGADDAERTLLNQVVMRRLQRGDEPTDRNICGGSP